MAHTTDDGYTWNSISIMPSLDSMHSFTWITPTENPNRFYTLIARNRVPQDYRGIEDTIVRIPSLAADFVETTDDGNSWRIDSSIGSPRIYWLASSAPNKLWAFVGRVPRFCLGLGFLSYTSAGSAYPRQFSDSLFYSPDDGGTWYRDTTTFIGDTLLEMCWPDSTHGYIATWRDSTLLVYRFVPNESGVSTPALPNPAEAIFPNPASTSCIISFAAPGMGLHLIDMLGRDVLSAKVLSSGALALDVSRLPRGMYEVMEVKHGQMVLVGRIVLQ